MPLSTASVQALSRLRAYITPPTLYYALPPTRRAAVLLLLFTNPSGELCIVLTVRSAHLTSFAGHVAFPGGKSDTASETALQTALREAHEEIGLSPDAPLEQLCEMPVSLAVTNVGVRPCVAFFDGGEGEGEGEVEEVVLAGRVQEAEVQSVFAVPLEWFLGRRLPGGVGVGEWYKGEWVPWNGKRWKMHEFQAPARTPAGAVVRHRVWGMTARILVDLARIAYGREPEFSCVQGVGDEEMVKVLLQEGELLEGVEVKGELAVYSRGVKGNL